MDKIVDAALAATIVIILLPALAVFLTIVWVLIAEII
tara:strand:- start:745 stop:855 length:111 start_codon:yes stop_codon:yes gene_type:complete